MISPKPKGWVSDSASGQGLAHLSWTWSCFCRQLLGWLGLGGWGAVLEWPQRGWLGNLPFGFSSCSPGLSSRQRQGSSRELRARLGTCMPAHPMISNGQREARGQAISRGGELHPASSCHSSHGKGHDYRDRGRIGAIRVTHLPWWEKAMKERIREKGEIAPRCLKEWDCI